MNQQISKSTKNSKLILVIILAVAFLSGMILAWQHFGVSEEETKVSKVLGEITPEGITGDKISQCSPIDIPGYEVAKNNDGKLLEFYIDLNDDQKEEFIRVYRERSNEFGGRKLPIMVKIFSGTKECPKESFNYQGSGNEVLGAQVFSNFWGDGANAVMVKDVSWAGGSGSSVVLRFFTCRNGEYVTIEGSQFSGHNWQCCKFDDENAPGKKIIGAESCWAPDYSDYCAGCPSRFKFFIYIWNGEEYIKTEGGTTKNKYLGDIGKILQKEPFVLNVD